MIKMIFPTPIFKRQLLDCREISYWKELSELKKMTYCLSIYVHIWYSYSFDSVGSSAYDSVDHSILIRRLTTSFGLVDQPLAWLKSFLSDCSSCVVIGPSRSSWVPAPFGVPQDSVLGPLLYLLYTADIGPLLTELGLLHHLFADDVQAYVHTDSLAAETVLTQMSQAIDVLTSWMAANRLLLNPSKTQAIWLGGHRQL